MNPRLTDSSQILPMDLLYNSTLKTHMVPCGYLKYWGDLFVKYMIVEPLCHTSEPNIIVNVKVIERLTTTKKPDT